MKIGRYKLVFLSCSFLLCSVAFAAELPILSEKQQEEFLAGRTSGSMLGKFDSFASLIYVAANVVMYPESESVAHTELISPFPKFYKPTWAELFDEVARQTNTHWQYAKEHDYWVFSYPPLDLPYTIELAKGWRQERRGNYVSYIPSIAPVGMDIYIMGQYSMGKDLPNDLFLKIREHVALLFAHNFNKTASIDDMKRVNIGDSEALFYYVTVPETGIIWRQWVFIENGFCFAIVSALDPKNEGKLFPEVDAMIKSFRFFRTIFVCR